MESEDSVWVFLTGISTVGLHPINHGLWWCCCGPELVLKQFCHTERYPSTDARSEVIPNFLNGLIVVVKLIIVIIAAPVSFDEPSLLRH